MASIITRKYRTDNTELFHNDFDLNDYYVFISSLEREVAVDSEISKKEFLEKTIFGKKIPKENSFYAFQNNIWEGNSIYDQYDDKEDMSTKNFYVIVYPENNDTGNYLVFKCLFNNYGGLSITPPNFIPENISNIYRTADGYVWKFMFQLSATDFEKYTTLGYAPIIAESSNTEIEDSAINIILIENFNTNNGYEDTPGIIETVDGTGLITVKGTSLSEITNYYSGMFLYAININNVGGLYEIKTYSYNQTNNEGRIEIIGYAPDSILVPGTSFNILPKIEVKGDGDGCKAIPVLESGRITRILVLEPGEGYTSAVAEVVDPFGFNADAEGSFEERAILRPTLSPKGGHGSNIKEELLVRRLLLYTEITPENNNVLPTTNQYSKIGIVKNPEFNDANTFIELFDNRLELELNSAEGLFVGEIMKQIVGNEITFEGTIHEISGNTIFLTDYMGPYKKYEDTDISINPTLNILSSQNAFFNINNIVKSEYKQKSGDVYYMVDFEPVERTSESNEEYKILLEF
jgi:hypothetical protein